MPADDERESIFSVTTATTTTTTTTTRRCFEEKTRKKKQKRTRIDFAPGRWARGTRKGPKGPPHIVCFFLVFLFLFLFLAPWVMFPYPFIFFSSPVFSSPHYLIFGFAVSNPRRHVTYARSPPVTSLSTIPGWVYFWAVQTHLRVLSIRHRRCHDPRSPKPLFLYADWALLFDSTLTS